MRLSLLLAIADLIVACTSLPVRAQVAAPTIDPAFQQQFEAGQHALDSHQYQDAIAAFKRANKVRGNSCAQCYFGTAIAHFHEGDMSKTLENADKAIQFASDDATRAAAHNLKGKTFVILNEQGNSKLPNAEAEYRIAAQLKKDFAQYHMNLALVLLRESKNEEAKPELEACLSLKPDDALGHQARMILEDPRRGTQEFAPDFHLTSVQGQEFSLQGLSGRVVVMDFWATWCPPCRESVPELKDVTRKYSSDKFFLISISADSDEAAWKEFIAKKKMDWPQYRDSDRTILRAFGVHSFPTYLVMDGDGIIRQRIVGLNPRETVVHRLKETLQSMPQLEGVARK